jgi:hypothetical protein
LLAVSHLRVHDKVIYWRTSNWLTNTDRSMGTSRIHTSPGVPYTVQHMLSSQMSRAAIHNETDATGRAETRKNLPPIANQGRTFTQAGLLVGKVGLWSWVICCVKSAEIWPCGTHGTVMKKTSVTWAKTRALFSELHVWVFSFFISCEVNRARIGKPCYTRKSAIERGGEKLLTPSKQSVEPDWGRVREQGEKYEIVQVQALHQDPGVIGR